VGGLRTSGRFRHWCWGKMFRLPLGDTCVFEIGGLAVWRHNNNNKKKTIDIPYSSNVKVQRKKKLFMGLPPPPFSHPDSLECWYLGHETAWTGSV